MVEILDLIEKMYDAIWSGSLWKWVSEISPFLNAFDTINFDILLISCVIMVFEVWHSTGYVMIFITVNL